MPCANTTTVPCRDRGDDVVQRFGGDCSRASARTLFYHVVNCSPAQELRQGQSRPCSARAVDVRLTGRG